MEWTGGCLCGAIRYRASQAPEYASYCHCGMCRKASGAPFAGFVEFPKGTIEWRQGAPKLYHSSEGVIRRFCGDCGGPLTFEADGVVFVTLGSLDHPEHVEFSCHTYTNSKLPQVKLADDLSTCPGPAGGKGGKPLD